MGISTNALWAWSSVCAELFDIQLAGVAERLSSKSLSKEARGVPVCGRCFFKFEPDWNTGIWPNDIIWGRDKRWQLTSTSKLTLNYSDWVISKLIVNTNVTWHNVPVVIAFLIYLKKKISEEQNIRIKKLEEDLETMKNPEITGGINLFSWSFC